MMTMMITTVKPTALPTMAPSDRSVRTVSKQINAAVAKSL